MTSHELAKLLLTLPDLPVATHANNHTDQGRGGAAVIQTVTLDGVEYSAGYVKEALENYARSIADIRRLRAALKTMYRRGGFSWPHPDCADPNDPNDAAWSACAETLNEVLNYKSK